MNKKDIKVIFIGSANFSIPILEMLLEKYTVPLVITEIDKVGGRGNKIMIPPTKILAQSNNIPCLQPSKLKNNNELLQQIKDVKADLIVVAAYGKILPPDLLNVCPGGCLNVHPSLLPKYRGPAPIQSALLKGDKKTGVSIIKLDEKMDAGPILVQAEIDLVENAKYATLESELALKSARMLDEVIIPYLENKIMLQEQEHEQASFCVKIDKLDGKLDFNESCSVIINKFRAYHNWPGLYCFYKKQKLDLIEVQRVDVVPSDKPNGIVFKDGRRVFVKCRDGAIELLKVKLESKKEALVSDFINGHQDFIGSILE